MKKRLQQISKKTYLHLCMEAGGVSPSDEKCCGKNLSIRPLGRGLRP